MTHPPASQAAQRRRLVVVASILGVAAVQAILALGAFGLAFGIADGGDKVPLALTVIATVLGFPGLYLAPVLQVPLGEPTSLFVAAGIGGLAWSLAIAWIFLYLRRRRTAKVSGPAA